jgi:hypothetical protein
MIFRSWLRNLRSRYGFTPRKRPAPRRRLLLEALEARVVPTVYNVVPNLEDGAVGSLRDAVKKANADPGQADDYIVLPAGTFELSKANNGQENDALTGDLDITSTKHRLHIMGVAGQTIIKVDSERLMDRIFQIIHPGTQVFFEGLILEDGVAVDNGTNQPNSTDALGGAILNQGGLLTFDNVVFVNNRAMAGPGADATADGAPAQAGFNALGGAICSIGGSLTFTNCKIGNNQALAGPGGSPGSDLSFPPGADGGVAQGGGVYARNTTITLTSSDLEGNMARGGHAGDILPDSSTSRTGRGGTAQGGGLFATRSNVTLTDTDVRTNKALGGDGGDSDFGAADSSGGDGAGGGLFIQLGSLSAQGGAIDTNMAVGGKGSNGSFRSDASNGGRGQGGGVFGDIAALSLSGGEVNGNIVRGGNGGHGISDDEVAILVQGEVGGPALPAVSGGQGGDAEGGGVFVGGGSADLTDETVAMSSAFGGMGGTGQDGNPGGDGDSNGGDGGDGGDARGAGLYARDADVTLTRTEVLASVATAGNGGVGGLGPSTDNSDYPDYGEEAAGGGIGGNGGTGQGGGVYVQNFTGAGQLTLTDCWLSNNVVLGGTGGNGGPGGNGDEGGGDGGPGGSGGAAQGGGIFADDYGVMLIRSTISTGELTSGNGGNGGPGGTSADAAGGSGNQGGAGGNAQGGGLFGLGSAVSLVNSTVSGNDLFGGNGGPGGPGGAGDNNDDAGSGGGGGNGGLLQGGGVFADEDSSFAFYDTTIAFNSSVDTSQGGVGGAAAPGGFSGPGGASQHSAGGGVHASAGGVNAFNTLIAENQAVQGPDFDGNFQIARHVLLGIGDGSNLSKAKPNPAPFAVGNLVGDSKGPINPQLLPLAIYGGRTPTHALPAGSAAIDAGENSSIPGGVTTDQRGAGFPRIVNKIVDIGAYETAKSTAPPAHFHLPPALIEQLASFLLDVAINHFASFGLLRQEAQLIGLLRQVLGVLDPGRSSAPLDRRFLDADFLLDAPLDRRFHDVGVLVGRRLRGIALGTERELFELLELIAASTGPS